MTARPLAPRRSWRFTVYGGLYALSAARDALVSIFGADSKYPDGRLDGQTALFAEKLLTPTTGGDTEPGTPADMSTSGDQREETAAQPRIPRLRMTVKTLHEFVADPTTGLGVAEVLKSTGIRA